MNKTKIKKIVVTSGIIGMIGLGGFTLKKHQDNEKENNFQYVVENDGAIGMENSISYEELLKYQVLQVKLATDEQKYFIGRFDSHSGGYSDIFTNCDIYSEVLDQESIAIYLESFDLVKGKYKEEDIKELYQEIIELKQEKMKVLTQ